jgi:hypothetical protein
MCKNIIYNQSKQYLKKGIKNYKENAMLPQTCALTDWKEMRKNVQSTPYFSAVGFSSFDFCIRAELSAGQKANVLNLG